MFTGIIEKVAQVQSVHALDGYSRLSIETGYEDLTLGESVAVNGTCLTVVELAAHGRADFFVSRESLERTNLGRLTTGSYVNLERALAAGARLSGHWVQGHVDGLGQLSCVTQRDGSHDIEVELPSSLGVYCVEKGSITLDGVSLTLNQVRRALDSCRVSIVLIPHTWEHTRFSRMKTGDALNVEVDILAKYVTNYLERLTPQLCTPSPTL